MLNQALKQRIIETADEYHFVAEDQWNQLVDVAPTDEESEFEFRRLARAALRFYGRSFLILHLVESDDEQELEEIMELITEQDEELDEFFTRNDVVAVFNEENHENLSRVFSIAEAFRSMLLERSNQLAATLGTRF